MFLKFFYKYKFIFILIFILILYAIYIITRPIDLNISYSKIYLYENGEYMRMKLSDDGFWRFYIKNSEVPPLLRNSILVFEDKYFYYHPGVNPFSIVRAIVSNLKGKRIGASTITMQIARMFEPKERTFINKIREMIKAFQIEINYTKEEILNLYFNKAPYGGNIEGVKAASYFYFGKKLKDLTISEIAILTTIPKNPNKNRPDKQKNLIKKRNRVLKRMFDNNLITKEQFERAKKEPIFSKKRSAAFSCVQYTNKLKSSVNYIKTSINEDLQNHIQGLLKMETKKRNKQGIFNSAAIVIDNSNMEIKAYVASNDFNDKIHGGENDGILMKKSPGSTLKPFVYALALDEGLITLKKKLLDVPLSYGSYIPKNFNNIYYGQLSAEESLKLSLNAPVVDIQNQLDKNSLFEFLERANIPLFYTKKQYGLSIAVGGMDISLFDLTKLYTILANYGILKTNDNTRKRFLSKGASYLISSVLSENYRNTLAAYWDSSPDMPKFAFKTGTSAHAKHLYTIGYSPEYTIGVWFGNFNGKKPYEPLSGLKVVSDVLTDIFSYINLKIKKISEFKRPKEIESRRICSSYVTKEKCEDKFLTEDLIIKGIKPRCMSLNTQKIKYLIDFGEIKSVYELLDEKCYQYLKKLPPEIISPANNEVFLFNKLIPDDFKVIKIACKSYDSGDDVEVYLDLHPIENNSFVNLNEGIHQIQCVDKNGLSSKISFELKNEY